MKAQLTKTEITIFLSQVVCILFYGLFVKYEDGVSTMTDPSENDGIANFLTNHYP